MPTDQRITCILGLLTLLEAVPDAHAAPGSARRAVPRMSGPRDKPVPEDSRFPGRHPRPSGALLAPLFHPALRLVAERIRVRCRFRGAGCAVRHEFEVRNRGDALTIWLPFVSPRRAVLAEVDGRRAVVDDRPAPARPRRWASSGQTLDPATGKRYTLPGPPRFRVLRHHRVQVSFPAHRTTVVTLITNSVGGYDRFRRGRTQPEVSFVMTRRADNFVHHHELPLADPEARPTPGVGQGIRVELTAPADLVLRASTKLTCRRTGPRRAEQTCTGRLDPGARVLRWSAAERYRRPVGFFFGAGLAFTHRGAEALLRGGASVMLRSRKDLLTLSAETDARERFALALTYQLFLPYAPHKWELGAHFELGLVLDAVPAVRPALRAGAALHMAAVRVNLLLDLYPGELKKGGGPSWRGVLAVGLGF